MIKIREAVDFVHSTTVAGMNAGKSLSELMVEIRLPEHLLLSETHGKVSWAVKSIWEYYATWFHFDRTSELYATPQSAVLGDLAAIIDADAALSLVHQKLQGSELEQALLLLELFEGLNTEPELIAPLMELRVKVLSQLRERARVTGNDYELYWLGSELEKARSELP